MDLNFTEEQVMVRDSVSSYLAQHYSFEKREKILKGDSGWSKESWHYLAQELGVLGASFSEELGGFGGGPIEAMILAEEFGKALTLEPYIETVVICGGFLKYSDHPWAADLIEQIISGELLMAFAQAEKNSRFALNQVETTATKSGSAWVLNGTKRMVLGPQQAGKFIVSARTSGNKGEDQGISLFVVDAAEAGLSLSSYKTYDGRLAANVTFNQVSLGADALLGEQGAALPLIEQVMSEAVAATCAEANGVLLQIMDKTLEYTQVRKQFGKPLSAFQALQHQMVDMFTDVEQSTSMAWLASIRASESDSSQRNYACSAAKAFVSKACKKVGQRAIQLHGGMGLTDEMAISHYFKRATVLEQLYGSADYHLGQIEKLSYSK